MTFESPHYICKLLTYIQGSQEKLYRDRTRLVGTKFLCGIIQGIPPILYLLPASIVYIIAASVMQGYTRHALKFLESVLPLHEFRHQQDKMRSIRFVTTSIMIIQLVVSTLK